MNPNIFNYFWKHSRSEQLFVLMLIALSLPFYWLSLDIPKRIINDALQGHAFADGKTKALLFEVKVPFPDWLGGTLTLSDGVLLEQTPYLLALSLMFLFFVLANGAFKNGINIQKGILAERVMRRMRFELFSLMMRFRPEDIRVVKPAEAASIIKDEIEPIGAFSGDAFIQPAMLGTQALTALIFIMVQSLWLGMVALSVVLVQAVVIPYLRREQLRLGRLRQMAARKLAGRIGEMVDNARTIQTHNLTPYTEAEIGDRLGEIFSIRTALYRRKYAVKYLNTLLAETTPFFFYAIGGYFALRGSLDIGQLIAVIAAYRDLPPPIKELIDWDQRRADVKIKYEQVLSQFSNQELLPQSDAATSIDPTAPIIANDLTLLDQRGTPLISAATFEIARPNHVAIVGSSGSGRDPLARVLGRQITNFEGRVSLGDRDISSLSQAELTREISYVAPDAALFAGTIRDNVTLSLRSHMRELATDADVTAWQEAKRTGNPVLDPKADWIDYDAAGVATPEELEDRVLDLLRRLGMDNDLYNYGLRGLLPDTTEPELKQEIVQARRKLWERMVDANLDRLIVPFDPARYNAHATIGQNLVFGVIDKQRLSQGNRARNSYFRTLLNAESLAVPFAAVGLRLVENAIEVFADLPSGHALYERFSMIRASKMDVYTELLQISRSVNDITRFPEWAYDELILLALDYIEPRHRLGLVTPELSARILRARESFRKHLPQEYEDYIEFYDPDRALMSSPMRDNLLFGRVAQNAADAEKRVLSFLKESLPELGMDRLVYSLGLDYDVGPKGQTLFATQRAAINLARGIIRKTPILILEDPFNAYLSREGDAVLKEVIHELNGRTLIVTTAAAPDIESFNTIMKIENARVTMTTSTTRTQPDSSEIETDLQTDTAHADA